jgi:outer membrane protein, heavy metal efflux system
MRRGLTVAVLGRARTGVRTPTTLLDAIGRQAAASVTLFAVLALNASASAGQVRLTMDEAVARAAQAHPDVAAARRAVDIAEAGLLRSKAWLPANPYLSGGAGTTTQQGAGNNYGFYISQEVEIAGQRAKRIDVATQDIAKAASELTGAQQTLAAAVKTAFVQGLVGIDRVPLARQGLDVTTELSTQLSRIKNPSDAQRIDRNNAQIQDSRARRDIAAMEQARDNALTTIRRLVGLPLEQGIVLVGTPTLQVRPLPGDAELVARALRQRPDLVAQQRALDKADAQIALVEREAIPNVTLSGNLSRFEGATLAGGDIGVHLPVFQRKTSEINEAAAERGRERSTMESLKRTTEQEVIEGRRSCEVTALDLQTLMDVEVPKNEENLQLERRLHENGDATYADVLSAQLDLLAARRAYLDAVQAYNEALIELERIVGGTLEP